MRLERLEAWRLPLLAMGAVVVALGVVGLILLLGRAPGTSEGSPTPTAPATPSTQATAAPEEEVEAAVRAFFDAFAEARQTGDATRIEPYVNGTDSSAYLTAAGFLNGQTAVGKASIITVNDLSDFEITIDRDRAEVEFDHTIGGYDIDLESRAPLESPVMLPIQRKAAELVYVDDGWLVDRFEDVP